MNRRAGPTCPRCGAPKNAENFTANKNRSDGFAHLCRDCTGLYHRKWSADDPQKVEHARWKHQRFAITLHGRAVLLLNNARQATKRRALPPCELTVDWLKEKMRGTCEVTGLPFVFRVNGGMGHRENSFSPSIDRIEQRGPYVPSNCRVVVWIYNRARGAFPSEDLERMARALVLRRAA